MQNTNITIGQLYHITHKTNLNIDLYAVLESVTNNNGVILNSTFKVAGVPGFELSIDQEAWQEMTIVDCENVPGENDSYSDENGFEGDTWSTMGDNL